MRYLIVLHLEPEPTHSHGSGRGSQLAGWSADGLVARRWLQNLPRNVVEYLAVYNPREPHNHMRIGDNNLPRVHKRPHPPCSPPGGRGRRAPHPREVCSSRPAPSPSAMPASAPASWSPAGPSWAWPDPSPRHLMEGGRSLDGVTDKSPTRVPHSSVPLL